jgi:predicted nucleotidyltransferase
MTRALIAAEREAVREFLERVRRDLQQADASAVVFGSRVRGEADNLSDLDIVVIKR